MLAPHEVGHADKCTRRARPLLIALSGQYTKGAVLLTLLTRLKPSAA